ncbi:hypothetical protein BDV23DRAFT_180886 [Aspergillus alliaceus]|uniref:Uncharacterized protein n=1 Tax=Petromyces alliaceus TaxID=209559 RepID=A0A5N7CHC3_PETAA|nr:hypothetical protein BDV23DRAFT_180886 [Aspergillus alliaceus]
MRKVGYLKLDIEVLHQHEDDYSLEVVFAHCGANVIGWNAGLLYAIMARAHSLRSKGSDKNATT